MVTLAWTASVCHQYRTPHSHLTSLIRIKFRRFFLHEARFTMERGPSPVQLSHEVVILDLGVAGTLPSLISLGASSTGAGVQRNNPDFWEEQCSPCLNCRCSFKHAGTTLGSTLCE